jgi:hypothetical protein
MYRRIFGQNADHGKLAAPDSTVGPGDWLLERLEHANLAGVSVS